MTDFTASAAEVFQLLQSFDYTVMLYGADGNRVEDPALARRLFARPENLLVSLIDDGDDSCIRLYIGNKTRIDDILGLLLSLRTAASKYNLLFNVRQYGREIQPKDFAGEAITEARGNAKMKVFEGMYGTSRSSYLKLENARMIVRHSTKVDETKLGARSRFVESIFIENASGERMLFPTNHLAPARAMTQHVNMGGGFADPVGQQIGRMAQDYAHLGACTSYVTNNATMLPEGAGVIGEQCRTKMREMKKTFERMYRSENGYMAEAKKLEDAARTLTETDSDQTVPPEKIEELRKTLNLEGSSLLSDAVFESVCKCCASEAVTEDQPVSEAAPPATVSVLGRQVDADAWAKLKNNQIDLIGKPELADAQGRTVGYASKSGELVYKLGSIVPLVKNDSLMNLLSFVADRMPEERDPEIAKKMRTLALYVVKSVGLSMNEGIAEGSQAIRDLRNWLARFDPVTALREWGPSHPYHHAMVDDAYDDALGAASDEFTLSEFFASPAGRDLLAEHEPHDDEDEMTISEIKHALEDYFGRWIEMHHDKEISDLGELADGKLSEVIAHLAREGYQVAGDTDDTDADSDHEDTLVGEGDDLHPHPPPPSTGPQMLDDGEMDDGADPMMDADEMDECDLTREDVLLPHPNKGQNLAREVTPRTVKDPDTGKDTEPDTAYISRLRALSGMTAPNRQF